MIELLDWAFSTFPRWVGCTIWLSIVTGAITLTVTGFRPLTGMIIKAGVTKK